jgi:hypothetical protein
MQAPQPAAGLCRQVAERSRLQFVGQASAQKACAVIGRYHPQQAAPELAQVVEAEIVQSGDLGLQRGALIQSHRLKGQAAIR